MISPKLLKKVNQYILGSISLYDLEDWYIPRLVEFISDLDSDDAKIMGIIELSLVGINDGICTEDELKKELNGAVHEIIVE